MKLVPEGTSKKTGKKYQAFMACRDFSCNETAPATNVDPEEQMEEFVNDLDAERKNDAQQKLDDIPDSPELMTDDQKMWRAKEDREAKREKEKGVQITRLTLAKSFIQANVDFDNAKENNDLEKWTEWVLER